MVNTPSHDNRQDGDEHGRCSVHYRAILRGIPALQRGGLARPVGTLRARSRRRGHCLARQNAGPRPGHRRHPRGPVVVDGRGLPPHVLPLDQPGGDVVRNSVCRGGGCVRMDRSVAERSHRPSPAGRDRRDRRVADPVCLGRLSDTRLRSWAPLSRRADLWPALSDDDLHARASLLGASDPPDDPRDPDPLDGPGCSGGVSVRRARGSWAGGRGSARGDRPASQGTAHSNGAEGGHSQTSPGPPGRGPNQDWVRCGVVAARPGPAPAPCSDRS